MAEDEGRTDDGTEDETENEDGSEEDEREDGSEDGGEENDPAKLRAELDKAIKRRDRALADRRAAREELAKATKSKDDQPDPVAEANSRLVRAEAKSVLAAAGVTDKDDQAAVLDVLHLADIEVDSRGDVDTDAIEDRVARLREIFGGAASNGRRPRPRVDTRDKGRSGSSSSDPDSERYKRILNRR
jgi:hypothetical protein